MEDRQQEQSLLGALIKNSSNIGSVSEVLQPEDITWIPYRQAYEVIQYLTAQKLGVDTITIGDRLEREDKLESFCLHDSVSTNGRQALTYLRGESVSENAITYAKNVKNYAINRVILDKLSKGAEWVKKGRNPSDIISDVTRELGKLDTSTANENTQIFHDAIAKAWDITDRATKGDVSFIPTGFSDLDRMIVGLSGPDMTIVGARPGVGKTSFLASIVRNIMFKQTKRIAFFTLEMGNEQIAMRFIAMQSGINFLKQRSGNIRDDEMTKYIEAVGDLTVTKYPLFINDLPGLSPNKIRQELRRLGDIDLCIVDYLQLANSDEKNQQRHLEVAAVGRGLKSIARQFNIPVLVAAQLNRAGEARGDEPKLSDLRESGSLEQDADNVLFLHRERDEAATKLIIAKQRNGGVGTIYLNYNGERTLFESVKK